MRDHNGAALAELLIPADVIAMIVGVDEEAHGLLRDGGDRGLELVVHLGELAVDHDDAVVAGGNRRVAPEALEHVRAVAEIEGLDFDLRPVGSDGRAGRRWLLCKSGPGKTGHSGKHNECDFFHDFPPYPI